jgi:TetR/AcrR family transcriptional regulator, transcriptional repressor for nem operon
MNRMMKTKTASTTQEKILQAAILLMRQQGFCATTVDQVCAEAGVTKGAFFHYYKSKEEIGQAAVQRWCQSRAEGYRLDLGDPTGDPLVQLNRLLDGLMESVRNPPDGLLACLLGMVSQELGTTHESMRAACSQAFAGWTSFVAQLLGAAREVHPVRIEFEPDQIGWMLNSLWQGSLLVAKTRQDPEVVLNNLRHARAYIDSLFEEPGSCGPN